MRTLDGDFEAQGTVDMFEKFEKECDAQVWVQLVTSS
jgi:hypothetical protein